ncbi:MAG: Gfo/Idh/MocA family oxidoreductase [Planctomycetales bacterium]
MSSLASEVPAVRVGVIGLGRRGMHHLERLSLRSDMIAVAAHDADPGRAPLAAAFGARFHRTPIHLLRDPEVEAVLVATPAATHHSHVVNAVGAGKHAIVERPLCETPRQADVMLAAAHESGRRLAVLQPRRWDDDFRTALDAVRTGKLGELKQARLIVWGLGCWEDEEASGGVLLDRGADYFDQLVQFIPSRPIRIFARLGPLDPATGAERGFTAIVDFENGAEAHLDVDLDHPAELRAGWTLAGTAGAYRRFQHYSIAEDGEVIDVPLEPLPSEGDRMYEEIVAHLRRGAPLAVTPEQSRAVVALLDASRRSARLGQPLAFGD